MTGTKVVKSSFGNLKIKKNNCTSKCIKEKINSNLNELFGTFIVEMVKNNLRIP